MLFLIAAETGFSWPYLAGLSGALYGVATLTLLLAELRLPYSPGANDNASAVAVNLEIASKLAQQPLQSTDVWLAFTVAEEVDHRGLKKLLREHKTLRKAAFIDLEGVEVSVRANCVTSLARGSCGTIDPIQGFLNWQVKLRTDIPG